MHVKHINYTHPDTLDLAHRLKCAPANASPLISDLVEQSLSVVRRRYGLLAKIGFSMFSLDETLMTYRLIRLTDEYLDDNPHASNEEILTHLLGNGERLHPHYLPSEPEERYLILAYQKGVPGSVEMVLTFFAPKIIATIKPLMFGISPDNHEDIEAVCLGALDRLLKEFDPDVFDAGLPQNLVSLELSNDILEEFGQDYTITLHRRQINYLRQLHSMMQDPDFASLSQSERAEEAEVPLAIVLIYDSKNAHATGADKTYHTASTHLDIQDDFLNSSVLTAIPSLALSMVEDEIDATIAEKDELFRELANVVVHWVTRHNTRPSVAGKKIIKEFAEIKEAREMSDAEFKFYMSEIIVWMKVYAHRLLP